MKNRKKGQQLGLAFGATVFLGGTVDSKWREAIIPQLQGVDAFNPVVPIEEWNEAAQAEERHRRETSDYCVYTITPKMTGVLAIAEAVDDSNKRPRKTVFCVHPLDEEATFTKSQMKSLDQVGKLVACNGGRYLVGLDQLVEFLNGVGRGA